jgi:dTDP-4-dehydrorhamnose 3,5-epimerase
MGGPLNVNATAIAGVVSVDTVRLEDDRGAFSRLFCEEELAQVIGHRRIVQVNLSRTAARGSVRGLHFQGAPHAEMKLVRCLRGAVWDVAVDLRADSPTYLQWHAQELTPGNGRMLVIPEGCAHGFQALEPDSELLYLHTAAFHAQSEGGVSCKDPALAIAWPLPVTGLSSRDASHPPIASGFKGLSL